MPLDNGWIKLERQIINWRWFKDGNTFHLFLYLLLKANITDADFENITIKRGQLVTSRKRLANALGLSERNIRTSLNHLKSTNEVTIRATPKFTIITIVNYDLYQSTDQQTDQRPTNYRPQYKKDKKEKDYIMSSCADSESRFDYQKVVDSYNKICVSLPKVKKITDSRRKQIKRAKKEIDSIGESFESLFRAVEANDFYSGRDGKWKGCSFDWVIKSGNIIKIFEKAERRGNENYIIPLQGDEGGYIKLKSKTNILEN